MGRFRAGHIVVADCRDVLPKEPNKQRPAVVIEDDVLFDGSYPNVILVPLTDDARLAIPDLAVAIEPSPENGCAKRCWALSHCAATTSAQRLSPTHSAITADQLGMIRRQVMLAIGAGCTNRK